MKNGKVKFNVFESGWCSQNNTYECWYLCGKRTRGKKIGDEKWQEPKPFPSDSSNGARKIIYL